MDKKITKTNTFDTEFLKDGRFHSALFRILNVTFGIPDNPTYQARAYSDVFEN